MDVIGREDQLMDGGMSVKNGVESRTDEIDSQNKTVVECRNHSI